MDEDIENPIMLTFWKIRAYNTHAIIGLMSYFLVLITTLDNGWSNNQNNNKSMIIMVTPLNIVDLNWYPYAYDTNHVTNDL